MAGMRPRTRGATGLESQSKVSGRLHGALVTFLKGRSVDLGWVSEGLVCDWDYWLAPHTQTDRGTGQDVTFSPEPGSFPLTRPYLLKFSLLPPNGPSVQDMHLCKPFLFKS